MPPEPSPAGPGDRLLIYDAECRLCVTAKHALERLNVGDEGAAGPDGQNIRYVPYQSEEAARRLGADYTPGRPHVAFLVGADGKVSRGLDAFLPLLPKLRGGRLLQALLRIPLFRPLAYAAYRMIARHRYRWFGRVATKPK